MLPTIFNDDYNVAALFNVVVPDTYNDDMLHHMHHMHDVELFNVVVPVTLNDGIHVVIFDNVVVSDTFNDDMHVVA
jgi:hypothetical protein